MGVNRHEPAVPTTTPRAHLASPAHTAHTPSPHRGWLDTHTCMGRDPTVPTPCQHRTIPGSPWPSRCGTEAVHPRHSASNFQYVPTRHGTGAAWHASATAHTRCRHDGARYCLVPDSCHLVIPDVVSVNAPYKGRPLFSIISTCVSITFYCLVLQKEFI